MGLLRQFQFLHNFFALLSKFTHIDKCPNLYTGRNETNVIYCIFYSYFIFFTIGPKQPIAPFWTPVQPKPSNLRHSHVI